MTGDVGESHLYLYYPGLPETAYMRLVLRKYGDEDPYNRPDIFWRAICYEAKDMMTATADMLRRRGEPFNIQKCEWEVLEPLIPSHHN